MGWQDFLIRLPGIGVEHGALTVDQWQRSPQLLGTLSIAPAPLGKITYWLADLEAVLFTLNDGDRKPGDECCTGLSALFAHE